MSFSGGVVSSSCDFCENREPECQCSKSRSTAPAHGLCLIGPFRCAASPRMEVKGNGSLEWGEEAVPVPPGVG